MKLLWPKDRRIYQVRAMLQSSTPAIIDIQHRPDVTAHEYIEEQEKHLFGICTRTMALPVGRYRFNVAYKCNTSRKFEACSASIAMESYRTNWNPESDNGGKGE